MANGEPEPRPHLIVNGTGRSHGFSSPRQGRRTGPVPARERPTHAAALREQLAAAATVEPEATLRLQLEFRSFEGIELATESLARDRSGIELLNVREIGERTLATVSVPAGRVAHFEKLITEYVDERKNRLGRPMDHQKLVDAIEQIRAATVRALWTDDADMFPASPEAIIDWEVWL